MYKEKIEQPQDILRTIYLTLIWIWYKYQFFSTQVIRHKYHHHIFIRKWSFDIYKIFIQSRTHGEFIQASIEILSSSILIYEESILPKDKNNIYAFIYFPLIYGKLKHFFLLTLHPINLVFLSRVAIEHIWGWWIVLVCSKIHMKDFLSKDS